MQDEKLNESSQLEHLDRVFPIVDVPSALLMKVKARCLFGAATISGAQLAEIDRRADETISRATATPDNLGLSPNW
jgi:hypothetical protein